MNYRFHEFARIELDDAALFYESQQEGLALRFARDVDHGISAILEAPQMWPEIEPGI